jgi:hypothetical protein
MWLAGHALTVPASSRRDGYNLVHWNTGDLQFRAVLRSGAGEWCNAAARRFPSAVSLDRCTLQHAAQDRTPRARARQQVVTARCAEATSNP